MHHRCAAEVRHALGADRFEDGRGLHLLARGPFSIEPALNPLTFLLLSATVLFFLLTLAYWGLNGAGMTLEVISGRRRLGAGLHPVYALVKTTSGSRYRTETHWVRLTAGP